MKNYIGIDFAKEKFDVALISSQYTENHSAEHAVFENTTEGFKAMLKWVKEHCPKASKEDLHFCGENTGVYSRPMADFMAGKGYAVYLENAYKIRLCSGLLRGKSDRKDALMIAEYILRNSDKAALYKEGNPVLKELDMLFKQRRFLVSQNTAIKNKLESIDFGIAKKKELEDNLSKYCEIKDGRASINFDNISKVGALEVTIVQNLIMLEFNRRQIKELDMKMNETVKKDKSVSENYDIVTSIPGVALQNAVALLVYTDNFERFGYDARKLASYYGVAVFGKDSGTSVHSAPHTSHLANKMLKGLLQQSAMASSRHCKPLRTYYERLILRGKKHQVAINNVKNKLLHMIMAMVKNKTKYDEEAYGRGAELCKTKTFSDSF